MNGARFDPPSTPVEILLDTDMATDCDDAGAMAVLHALADAGETRIAAIVVNNKDPHSVGAVAAINAFYGRADIPLGAYQGDAVGAPAGAFVHALAEDTNGYGHAVVSRRQVPSAVDVYRRTLAKSPDGAAVIVSIGHLNNLHDLLRSGADENSPLSGEELVRTKVAHMVVMGGDYLTGKEHNFFARGSDALSAAVVDAWPTTILFSGYALGLAVKTGPGLAGLPERHPVRRAYALHPTQPLERGRPSWDQTAVLAAVRGPGCSWTLSDPGINRVAADGSNAWESRADGCHAYLVERDAPANVAVEIERLMVAAGGGRQGSLLFRNARACIKKAPASCENGALF